MKIAERITDTSVLAGHMDHIMAESLVFGFDIETGYDGPPREKASVHPELMKVVGISYAFSTDEGFYVPLSHDLENNLPLDEVAEIMKPVLQSGLGVAHNAKFERRCLSQPLPRGFGYDCVVRSDTQIEAYCLQGWQSFALKGLVKAVFGYEQAEYASLFTGATASQLKRSRFNELSVSPQVVQYAVDDSIWCLALHLRHFDLVKDTAVFRLEMQVMDVVCQMETTGLFYDWEYLRRGAEGCADFVTQVEAEVFDDLSEMVGERIEINLQSNPQVAEVLYQKLGLPISMKSKKTGNPSVGADALTPLARQYPVVAKILWWKELKKLYGTYLAKYEGQFGYAEDGRTHPNVMQAVVVSGRFAVSDPPYQQTPKKYFYELDSGASWAFDFRPAIKPQPGNYFLYYDYSQVELRVVAGLANEQALINAFEDGTDVHRVTTALMLNVPFAEITGPQRDIGKVMNFALVYGMSTKMLAQRLAVTQERAEELNQAYFDTYTGIKVWRQRVIEEASAVGYTTSWLGRKHRIWEFDSSDRWVFEKGERLAGNAPVQGGAADYMKIAMVRQHRRLAELGLLDQVRAVANVHDSLTWEVDDSIDPHMLVRVLNPCVSFPVPGFPPITADWAVGLDWGNLQEVDLTTAQDEAATSVYTLLDAPAPPPRQLEAPPEPPTTPVEALESPLAPTVAIEPTPAPAVQIADDTKRLVVEMSAMPILADWVAFMAWVVRSPGSCVVHVVTPQGSIDLDVGVSYLVNPAEVITLLPTADAHWEVAESAKDLLVDALRL